MCFGVGWKCLHPTQEHLLASCHRSPCWNALCYQKLANLHKANVQGTQNWREGAKETGKVESRLLRSAQWQDHGQWAQAETHKTLKHQETLFYDEGEQALEVVAQRGCGYSTVVRTHLCANCFACSCFIKQGTCLGNKVISSGPFQPQPLCYSPKSFYRITFPTVPKPFQNSRKGVLPLHSRGQKQKGRPKNTTSMGVPVPQTTHRYHSVCVKMKTMILQGTWETGKHLRCICCHEASYRNVSIVLVFILAVEEDRL